jgi:hypothetical protein
LIELTAPMPVAGLERRVGVDLFDDALAVVERSLHREVVDVRVLQRIHLRALESAHAPVRREHVDVDSLAPAHRVLGRRAGVARGRRRGSSASFPGRPSVRSKSGPSNCIAMSLNASVGPLEIPSRCRPGSSVASGVTSSVPKTARL